MKKFWIIGTLAVLALVVFGGIGYAYAQSQETGSTNDGISFGCHPSGSGRRMMSIFGGKQGMGSCQSGDGDEASEYGPMHANMLNAYAQALGLTPEELETRRQAGDTLWDIAQEQGMTAEQFQEMITTVRASVINQAIADGVITQEQADFMLERMERMAENGFGPGYGAGNGGCGMRGNNQP